MQMVPHLSHLSLRFLWIISLLILFHHRLLSAVRGETCLFVPIIPIILYTVRVSCSIRLLVVVVMGGEIVVVVEEVVVMVEEVVVSHLSVAGIDLFLFVHYL